MVINIICGFMLPWVFGGLYLWKEDKFTLFLIYPLGSTLAFTINLLGLHFEWWELAPYIQEDESLSALPFILGLYPITACLLIHLINRTKINPFLLIIASASLITCLEWIYLLFGMVSYGNGWNIPFTFVSYLVPYLISFWYSRSMLDKKISPTA